MMRSPTLALAGHLHWTTSGAVWATWRIKPQLYGLSPLKTKTTVRDLHRLLTRSLTGEALMLGVAVSLDPVAIVERQLEGMDLDQYPELCAEAEANLDRLEQMVLGERAYYLSIPLANTGSNRVLAPARAALATMADSAGLPKSPPSEQEVLARVEQAQRIEALIPKPFAPTPITTVEQVWLAEHACRRGMLDAPPPTPGSIGEDLALSGGLRMPTPVLDEGAWADLDTPAALRNPMARRVLKIQDPRAADLGQPASYQCPMVVTDTPQGGVQWPGSELLDTLDNLTQDADWAIRLEIVGRDDVMRSNRRALRDLNDQFDQRSDELTTGTTELDMAAALLAEYQSAFAADRLEVEVKHTIIITIGDTSMERVDERAKALIAELGASDFRLERPLGGLETLWWAGQPGVPTSSAVRAWQLVTTSSKFAELVPYISTSLGGSKGPVWGLNRSNARTGVVHLDPGGYPEIDKSGSIVFVGELGSGKTVGLKSMANAILDTGGQMLAIDKSDDGEWARFAGSLVDPVIVDPSDLHWSMDPLRIFDDGAQILETFLTQLLGTSPQEPHGHTVAQVLRAEYRATHHLDSSQAVMEHLLGECALPHAHDLGERIRVHAEQPYGRLVFAAALPPVDGVAAAIVWRTNGTSQPTERELATPHLFRQLKPAKIFGRAYYSLLLAAGRRWAVADRSRVAVFICDEAYDIFGNPENSQELEHFGRQGRRPKALLGLGSHDPDHDFGDGPLRNLIPTRVVMRQPDETLARNAIRYLGVDEDDPAFEGMVEELRFNTSPVSPDTGVPPGRAGECFLRDAFGGVGRAQVLLPAVPARAKAATSTPPKRGVRA